MFKFFLVVHLIIAASLVGVILMQRSEGGGLAGGGSPAGLMTARGAADFLTRTTTILATLFVLLSIGLAGLATFNRAPTTVDTSLARKLTPATGAPALGTAPVNSAVPLAGTSAPANAPAPSMAPPAPNVQQNAPVAAGPAIATVRRTPVEVKVAPVTVKTDTSRPTIRNIIPQAAPKLEKKPVVMGPTEPTQSLPKIELPKVSPPPITTTPAPTTPQQQ